MQISQLPQAIFTASDTPVAPKPDSKESCCTRAFNAIKNALATFVYYLTCTCLDLRTKKVTAEPVLTALEKLEAEIYEKILETSVKGEGEAKTVRQLLESKDVEERLRQPLKDSLQITAKEFAFSLKQVFDAKIKSKKWELKVDGTAVILTIFPKEVLSNATLEKFSKRSDPANNKACGCGVHTDWRGDIRELPAGEQPKMTDYLPTYSIGMEGNSIPCMAESLAKAKAEEEASER